MARLLMTRLKSEIRYGEWIKELGSVSVCGILPAWSGFEMAASPVGAKPFETLPDSLQIRSWHHFEG